MDHDPLASLTLQQVKIFVAVAHEHSFARAAEHLYISQPTATLQIKRLEALFGSRLLRRGRGRRSVHLTESGAILLEGCEQVLRSLDKTWGAMEALEEARRGQVSLGVGRDFGSHALPQVHASFRRAFPDIAVRVVIGRPQQVVEDVRAGLLDLAVGFAPVEGMDLVAHPLSGLDMVLLGPAGHRLAGTRPAPFSELESESWVLSDSSTAVRRTIEQMARNTGTRLNITFEVGDANARLQAVMRGLGITAMSNYRDGASQLTSEVAVLNVEGFPVRLEWVLVHRNEPLRPSVSALKKHLLTAVTPSGPPGRRR